MKEIIQKSAWLYNGQKVKAGDSVQFINSDGETCVGKIQYDVNNPNKLFFWNNQFEIIDYQNARRI